MRTIEDIKNAVDAGKTVLVNNGAYEVIKDSVGQYLIHCISNDNYVGLHGRKGTKYETVTPYPLSAFYVKDNNTTRNAQAKESTMTEEQKRAFAEWIDDEHGHGCDEDDVAVTCDTAQMFFDAAREVGSVDTDTMPDGTPVTIYERLQLRKGDTRDDVYIADFGEFRAVVIC